MRKSQLKKLEILSYIQEHEPQLLGSEKKMIRLRECSNILRFINYWSWNTRLYTGNFCKYDRFCLACSTRRAIRKIKNFEKGILANGLETKHRYHITLTLRHKKSDSLEYLMERLLTLRKKLSQRIRNSKRDSHKTKSFFSKFEWMVASIEVTHGKNWRHPHMHILVCWDEDVATEYSKVLWAESNRELQREWYKLTKDSYCVGMRKVSVAREKFDRQGIAEVFKYAVKFSSLETPELVELLKLQQKHQYRFYSSYGIMRWWQTNKEKDQSYLSQHEIKTASHISFQDYEFNYKHKKFSSKKLPF